MTATMTALLATTVEPLPEEAIGAVAESAASAAAAAPAALGNDLDGRQRQRRGADSRMQLEGAQRGMRVASAREIDGLEHNLEFLANVGSIAPYVGLFGTVWGIMISFQGLANMKEATIATVAPGISEALIATAMGLFAAIPAVWAYNRFATKVDRISVRYEAFSEEFSSILERQSHTDDTPAAAPNVPLR